MRKQNGKKSCESSKCWSLHFPCSLAGQRSERAFKMKRDSVMSLHPMYALKHRTRESSQGSNRITAQENKRATAQTVFHNALRHKLTTLRVDFSVFFKKWIDSLSAIHLEKFSGKGRFHFHSSRVCTSRNILQVNVCYHSELRYLYWYINIKIILVVSSCCCPLHTGRTRTPTESRRCSCPRPWNEKIVLSCLDLEKDKEAVC